MMPLNSIETHLTDIRWVIDKLIDSSEPIQGQSAGRVQHYPCVWCIAKRLLIKTV
jgi:hypothetical protein